MRGIFVFLVITSSLVATMGYRFNTEIILEDVIPHVETCSPTQQNLARCVTQSLDTLRPYLADGISQLNIPSFEPYYIDKLHQTWKNTYNGDITFRDVMIHGLTKYLIHNIKFFNNITQIKFLVKYPFIKINSKQIIQGRILNKPIENIKCFTHINLTNTKVDIALNGKYFRVWNKSMEKFFEVTNVSANWNSEISSYQLANFKNRNFPLAKKILFLNEVWKIVKFDIRRKIKDIIQDTILTTANKIYLTFPIEILMPIFI